MTLSIGPEDLELFRGLVAERLGLRCDDADLDRLAGVLRQRMHDSRSSHFSSYALRWSSPATAPKEIQAVATLYTTGETSFLRNREQFRALTEVALAGARERTVRILSAGCSSGEEPYSLAITLLETAELVGLDVRITAFDVNPAAIEKARAARYSDWSLRDTPPEIRARYFRGAGRDHLLTDAVKRMVVFEERNLVDEDPGFWQPERFDVVFCRNVLMYFTPEAVDTIAARILGSIVPAGYLFLGYAENLRGVAKHVHLHHTHDTFYYQRRPEDEPHVAPAPPGPLDLTSGLELLEHERFADAQAFVQALPAQSAEDPDAQLLLGVVLTNAGRFREAEEVCRHLLELDDLSAGAHYLMALTREHEGDRAAAAEHNESAIYLDPTFAMPHLHIGLLAKQRGDVRTTRRAIGHALTLLHREDAARILLFGGGFAREALLEFCRTELRACGDA